MVPPVVLRYMIMSVKLFIVFWTQPSRQLALVQLPQLLEPGRQRLQTRNKRLKMAMKLTAQKTSNDVFWSWCL